MRVPERAELAASTSDRDQLATLASDSSPTVLAAVADRYEHDPTMLDDDAVTALAGCGRDDITLRLLDGPSADRLPPEAYAAACEAHPHHAALLHDRPDRLEACRRSPHPDVYGASLVVPDPPEELFSTLSDRTRGAPGIVTALAHHPFPFDDPDVAERVAEHLLEVSANAEAHRPELLLIAAQRPDVVERLAVWTTLGGEDVTVDQAYRITAERPWDDGIVAGARAFVRLVGVDITDKQRDLLHREGVSEWVHTDDVGATLEVTPDALVKTEPADARPAYMWPTIEPPRAPGDRGPVGVSFGKRLAWRKTTVDGRTRLVWPLRLNPVVLHLGTGQTTTPMLSADEPSERRGSGRLLIADGLVVELPG